MSRRGRPPKPPDERLTQVLHVRVTDPEFDAIHQRAAAARVKPYDLLRAIFREYLFPDQAGVS